jgi:hypothetical protein
MLQGDGLLPQFHIDFIVELFGQFIVIFALLGYDVD